MSFALRNTRLLGLAVLGVVVLGGSAPARAQHRRYNEIHQQRPAFSFGAYVGGGVNMTGQGVPGYRNGPLLEAGLYGEYSRHTLRAGLDMRAAGHMERFGNFLGDSPGTDGSDKLIGPRLSWSNGLLHPYAEALFGRSHQDVAFSSSSVQTFRGNTRMAAIGLDFEPDPHIAIRAFEYSVGRFDGAGGATKQTFTAGLVFRFP